MDNCNNICLNVSFHWFIENKKKSKNQSFENKNNIEGQYMTRFHVSDVIKFRESSSPKSFSLFGFLFVVDYSWSQFVIYGLVLIHIGVSETCFINSTNCRFVFPKIIDCLSHIRKVIFWSLFNSLNRQIKSSRSSWSSKVIHNPNKIEKYKYKIKIT